MSNCDQDDYDDGDGFDDSDDDGYVFDPNREDRDGHQFCGYQFIGS